MFCCLFYFQLGCSCWRRPRGPGRYLTRLFPLGYSTAVPALISPVGIKEAASQGNVPDRLNRYTVNTYPGCLQSLLLFLPPGVPLLPCPRCGSPPVFPRLPGPCPSPFPSPDTHNPTPTPSTDSLTKTTHSRPPTFPPHIITPCFPPTPLNKHAYRLLRTCGCRSPPFPLVKVLTKYMEWCSNVADTYVFCLECQATLTNHSQSTDVVHCSKYQSLMMNCTSHLLPPNWLIGF